MGHVFLSYAREDREFAECLARVLEGAGHSLWWDRQIDSGEEFSAEIEAELEKADAVLVAWSRDSVKSRWVRDEAAVGGDTGRLVPVSVDGSQPPMGFRQFHTMDLSGWKGGKRDKRTGQLLRAIERRAGDAGKPVPKAAPRSLLPRGSALRRAAWATTAALLLAVIAAAAFLATNREKSSDARVKPTIAIMPFTSASSDPELRARASQARDSIAHTFPQSGLPVRLLGSTPNHAGSTDFLINGDLSRSGDKVLAIVRLDETAHGVTVFSHRFEATGDDVSNLPERIGAQMAGNLTGSTIMMTLDRQNPLDPALLADLLQGADFATPLESLQTYQNAKRVAARAPDSQIAQVGVAFHTSFVLPDLPREERAEAVVEARRASERAMALGPHFGDAYAAWCYLHSEALYAECEDRLRTGRRMDPDAPWLNTFLSHLMRDVGRVDEAMDLARLSYNHDVYVPTKIAWMLKALETAGERDAAADLHRQGARWWPEFKPMFFRNRLFGLIEVNDAAAMSNLEKEAGSADLPRNYVDSDAIAAAVKAKSIPSLRAACPASDDYFLNLRCMIALASIGDQDGAYRVADKLYRRRIGRTSAETERIWLDAPGGNAPLEFVTSRAAAPMRRDPRYIDLAQRVGLLDYWRSGRPPDFCREQPEPVCAQLLKR
jgi:TolB-like protein